MTLKQITALALALTLVFVPADARRKPKVEPKIKVSCVGNSITYGMRLDDRERESYPAQLQALLGDRYEVGNFGKSCATATGRISSRRSSGRRWISPGTSS